MFFLSLLVNGACFFCGVTLRVFNVLNRCGRCRLRNRRGVGSGAVVERLDWLCAVAASLESRIGAALVMMEGKNRLF